MFLSEGSQAIPVTIQNPFDQFPYHFWRLRHKSGLVSARVEIRDAQSERCRPYHPTEALEDNLNSHSVGHFAPYDRSRYRPGNQGDARYAPLICAGDRTGSRVYRSASVVAIALLSRQDEKRIDQRCERAPLRASRGRCLLAQSRSIRQHRNVLALSQLIGPCVRRAT